MSVSAILNGQGKVPPHYIDFSSAPFTGYVTNPLSSDLECYNPATSVNHAIKEASYVSAGEVKTDAVDLVPGSTATAVDVKTSLSLAANKQVRFADEVEVTAQGSNKVFFTTDNGTKSFMGGSNAVEYAAATKVLTVNRPTVPPSPLLPGQGAVVNGSVTTVGAGVTSGGDVLANGILISKGGGQPRIEFQDGAGVAQMETGWSSATGRGVLRSQFFEAFNDNTKKYLINYGDYIGYLGLETQGVDTEIRHYNTGATVMETRVRVEGAGKVSITEGTGANATLRLENQGGKGGEIIASESGGYMSVVAQGGYDLIVESTGRNVDVITSQPDTTLTAWVNNGTASLIMTDTANVGATDITSDTITLTTGGLQNAVFSNGSMDMGNVNSIDNAAQVNIKCSSGTYNNPSLSFEDTDIVGPKAYIQLDPAGTFNFLNGGSATLTEAKFDGYPIVNVSAPTPILRLSDTASVSTVDIQNYGSALIFNQSGGQNNAQFNYPYVGTFSGAIDGAELGYDGNTNTNFVRGLGNTFTVKQSLSDAKAIRFEDNPTQKITIDVDVGELEVRGANVLSGAAGGNSGQHLVITINGTPYKIALLNP